MTILEQKQNILNKINQELKKSKISKPIREGFLISVIGKPNTGKSSFINFISNKEVSIVTNLPGTTTDNVSSVLDIDGYKCTFVDTAGLRKHKNKIEEIGIKKTNDLIMISDLNLVFLEKKEHNLYKNIKNKILIRSKFDRRTKKTLNKVNPHIEIISVKSKLNIDEVKKLAKDADVILDCSDNFKTRYSLNKIAFDLKKPLVSGAAIQFDGQLSVYDFRNHETPCYQCLFPDSSSQEEMRCSDHGVLSPVVGVIGSMQAVETLKLLLNIGSSNVGKLVIYDAKNMHWSEMKFRKDPKCEVCA